MAEEELPGAQGLHWAAAPGDQPPGAQGVQAAAPRPALAVPAGQGAHQEAFVALNALE